MTNSFQHRNNCDDGFGYRRARLHSATEFFPRHVDTVGCPSPRVAQSVESHVRGHLDPGILASEIRQLLANISRPQRRGTAPRHTPCCAKATARPRAGLRARCRSERSSIATAVAGREHRCGTRPCCYFQHPASAMTFGRPSKTNRPRPARRGAARSRNRRPAVVRSAFRRGTAGRTNHPSRRSLQCASACSTAVARGATARARADSI